MNYFGVCVGLCWARVGIILGLSWAILGYVGTFWHHTFILDLGISVSLFFPFLCCRCVLFSPCWANVEPPWSNICRCWVMSGNVGPVYVGPFWAMLGLSWATLAPYWAHVEPSWAMLGSVLAFVLDLGIWGVSDDLMVSWWSVGAVLVQTVQCLSLYCASASSWRFGMRVQCCVCEVFF